MMKSFNQLEFIIINELTLWFSGDWGPGNPEFGHEIDLGHLHSILREALSEVRISPVLKNIVQIHSDFILHSELQNNKCRLKLNFQGHCEIIKND
ncbi:hypothetical protein L195_g011258 [Trifolium pratense]|uniref:Uncharacterized protein n=1 Tax=Trifolium pratense TaxID=57577 RepID=A0A2K3PH43_TRIPR|nr:hypothetical protein L195_g011258 [Trifolium pratense]